METNKELIAQCEARAKQWLTPSFDEETRKEVQAMLDSEDKTALIDAFWHRRTARHYGCGYEPNEHLHRGNGDAGLRQLYPEGFSG